MKQLILLIPAVSKKVNIRDLQNKIVRYVGTRMCQQDGDWNHDTLPGIALEKELDKDDKDYLSELISTESDENCAIAFISYDSVKQCPYYIDATMNDYE